MKRSLESFGRVFSLQEVADRLGLSVFAIRQLISRGELRAFKTAGDPNQRGGRMLVFEADIVSMIERKQADQLAAGAR